MGPNFKFKAEVWFWKTKDGGCGWHFISLPVKLSKDIQGFSDGPRRGFGSIRVEVTIGKTSWKTSIFPDSKTKSYVLPLKKEVRVAEGIKLKDKLDVSITLQ